MYSLSKYNNYSNQIYQSQQIEAETILIIFVTKTFIQIYPNRLFQSVPYKLSEIFSIVPEYEGDQIFLGTFLNACDCAYQMASQTQKQLSLIHIKNKLRGIAAQLISSRNPLSYLEVKQLLNAHFGDTRDVTSLIQDLQRLKQSPSESPLAFFNRVQVLNAKM